MSCRPQINLPYAEVVRVLHSPIIRCLGSLTMNASVNKIASTPAGGQCIVYRLPGALNYEKMSERDFVISLYFCKLLLSSMSSNAPLRIPDFWFEDVIVPQTDNGRSAWNSRVATQPVVAKLEVQLGLLTGPGEFQAACQVAWLSVIHEVTKVWINVGGIHGCIRNVDGSCSMSQANEKVTCLEEFFFFSFFLIPVAEKAIIQEMESVKQKALSKWDTPVALIRGLGSGISSSHCAPNYKTVMTPFFPRHK